MLRAALKAGVEKGKLVMVKASYKLSPDEKKPPPKKKVCNPARPARPFSNSHLLPRPSSSPPRFAPSDLGYY